MPSAMILCGSAKINGVTMSMCKSAYKRLTANGYRADLIDVNNLNIQHCTDCGFCMGGSCIINDDMIDIYNALSYTDLLLIASPVHFGGLSSIIKTVIDRFQIFWFNPGLSHNISVAAMLCGGSKKPNFNHLASTLRVFAITTGMNWMGHIDLPNTDIVGNYGCESIIFEFIDNLIEF